MLTIFHPITKRFQYNTARKFPFFLKSINHDYFKSKCTGAYIQFKRKRHECTHGADGWTDHLPSHVLHHHRQSADSRRNRHGHGRGIRRHLHRFRHRLLRDGLCRQLSDCARAGYGFERLLYFRRRQRHGRALAGGFGRGVRFRHHFHFIQLFQSARNAGERAAYGFENVDCRRYRAVSVADCAQRFRHHRRQRRDFGEAGRHPPTCCTFGIGRLRYGGGFGAFPRQRGDYPDHSDDYRHFHPTGFERV